MQLVWSNETGAMMDTIATVAPFIIKVALFYV